MVSAVRHLLRSEFMRTLVRKSRLGSMSGSAVVELAVVGPLMVLMALGTADFGRVLYTSIILSHAARAGAQYGAQTNGTTADSDGIRQAALDEAADIGTVTITSARVCECTGTGSVSCTATCSGYGVPRVFVQVTASTTFRTIVAYPLIPNVVPLSVTAKVRRQ
jgi:Flp pilus assembly protein TadG